MLALAALDALGALLFGLVYVLGGYRLLAQLAFLAAIVVVFVALTALWVRVERSRGPARDVLSRAGRIAGGLFIAGLVVPGAVLMPLFFLHEILPPEAGLGDLLGPLMFVLLVSLVLVVLVNLAGVLYLLVSSQLRPRRAPGA